MHRVLRPERFDGDPISLALAKQWAHSVDMFTYLLDSIESM